MPTQTRFTEPTVSPIVLEFQDRFRDAHHWESGLIRRAMTAAYMIDALDHAPYVVRERIVRLLGHFTQLRRIECLHRFGAYLTAWLFVGAYLLFLARFVDYAGVRLALGINGSMPPDLLRLGWVALVALWVHYLVARGIYTLRMHSSQTAFAIDDVLTAAVRDYGDDVELGLYDLDIIETLEPTLVGTSGKDFRMLVQLRQKGLHDKLLREHAVANDS